MRRLVSVLLPLSFILVAACSSASPASSRPTPPASSELPGSSAPASGSPSGAPAAFTPWWTYHRTTSRSGHTTNPPGTLAPAWTRDLGQAVYGEPLVVGSSLIAATEGDRVVSMNPSTGHIRWATSLGTPQPPSTLPCGDIEPLGITSTPAYDASTGSVFVVAETNGGHHTLWALDAATGHKRWHRSLDVVKHRNRRAEQQRAAVLVADGHVLVSFGALAGDCKNYVGYITSTPTSGTGRIHHYAVPTERGGGMWSPSGPVLGRNGHVYVASANGAAAGPGWDRSNSVFELDAATLHVFSVFAPHTWRHDSLDDQGFGSTSPVSIPSLHRMVIGSKRSRIYLLREHFHGIGSPVRSIDGCSVFGGPAVAGHIVIEPCLDEGQVRALHVGSKSLHWRWKVDALYGSPIIAGQRVYVSDRDTGDLVVLKLRNGHVLQRIHAGDLTHFPSEVVDGGYVFVPTLTGITAFRG
jgi:outer membrane protein assembly factor BamB